MSIIKIAIVGSRSLNVDIEKYVPVEGVTLVVSGGAVGIDTLAEKFADKHGIEKLIFLPNYKEYGRIAPVLRNELIVDSVDIVYAFWDGISKGTKSAVKYATRTKKEVILFDYSK